MGNILPEMSCADAGRGVKSVLYDTVINKVGDDRNITLTIQQHYLLQMLLDSCIKNPSMFFTDFDAAVNGEDIDDFVDVCMAHLLDIELVATQNKYQDYYFFTHDLMQKTNGNNFTSSASAAQQLASWFQSAAANLDAWITTRQFYCRKGTWDCQFRHLKGASSGKLDVFRQTGAVQTSLYSGYDMYNASTIIADKTQSFSLTSDTLIKIGATVNGKNAASSSFVCFGGWWILQRTGD